MPKEGRLVMSTDATPTTVSLPRDLLDAVDRAVGTGVARSRNDLFATALRHYFAEQRRAAVDA